MKPLRRCGVAGILLVCAFGAGAAADLSPIQSGLDYHSFANTEQFRVTHVELNLRVDFTNQVLMGAVALEIKRLDPAATELVLDTRDLDVLEVTEKPTNVLGATAKSQTTWVSRPFHFDKADPILGSPLVIELTPSNKKTHLIRIDYQTSPSASALQWLTPKLNPGRHKPFLYTLSEPIGTRSWIPLQDTPQVRVTYSATIHTSSDWFAVMSARNDPKAKRNGEYSFVMQDAIPPYLIALAVGDLRYKEIGPRTGIYAERSMLSAGAEEFSDAERLLQAGEKLFGPYRWDRLDLLVLPPSFPVGGMENPRLSFVSPTIIAGDKSFNSVIVQALAHSWSGNLVTHATWRDVWISEGLAEYLESRIVNEVYSERREAMERVLGLQALRDSLSVRKPEDQILAIDLRGRDPDAAFSEVPYEKGRLFLTFLDLKFGRERFDAFLRGYFAHFEFKSVSTEQFLAYLKDNLLDRFPGVVSRDEVTRWVMSSGIPADAVLPTSNAFEPVDAARQLWLSGRTPAKKLATHDWAAQQWLYFLDGMPAALRKEQLADLDQAFKLTSGANPVLAARWFLLVIRNGYQPSYQRLEQYLQTVGRRKLIVPLYEELMKTPAGATLAKRVYALARPGYHPEAAASIDRIVTPASETEDE
jgi:leukotriene-A4 hydrolase